MSWLQPVFHLGKEAGKRRACSERGWCLWVRHRCGALETWLQLTALPQTGSVTLCKSLHLSLPQCPLCQVRLPVLPLSPCSDCKFFGVEELSLTVYGQCLAQWSPEVS